MKKFRFAFMTIFILITLIVSILFLIYKLFALGHPVLATLLTVIAASLFISNVEVEYVEDICINEEEEI